MKLTTQDLQQLLVENQGVLILKFSANWCGPCKKIKPFVDQYVAQMPQHVHLIHIDADESIELFSFFKNKRMLNGIPAMLAYYKGNTGYVPNQIAIGADLRQIDAFFRTCAGFSA